MPLEIASGTAPVEADVLVVPVFADRSWGPGAEEAVSGVQGLDAYLDAVDFSGKRGQIATVPAGGSAVMLVGLGDEVDAEELRRAAGRAGRRVRTAATVATTLHAVEIDEAPELVTLGFILGQYSFEEHRSEPQPTETSSLVLIGAGGAELASAQRGATIAAGVTVARDLVNRPAGHKPAKRFAEWAAEMAAETGLDIRIYDEQQIVTEGFGGLAGVAAGAHNPPRMVVLRHAPEGATATLALVGKGIVFDSGGLSLKPPKGMETMKTDMGGAAAVFGAMQVIARLGLNVAVTGILPLTENMPGGGATRPGDVLTIRNGKTIEVLNTDAEGRLVLADGLSLAAESSPDLIVDIATLTGAAKVALGPDIAGLFATSDEVAERVEGAARRAGEKVWRLPLERSYRKKIDSTVADMKNTGSDRWGGAITAALLLAEFVGDTPWAHLDVAGPARSESVGAYVGKGGTGFGVRTLVAIAEDLAG